MKTLAVLSLLLAADVFVFVQHRCFDGKCSKVERLFVSEQACNISGTAWLASIPDHLQHRAKFRCDMIRKPNRG